MTSIQRSIGVDDAAVTFTADPSEVASDGATVAFMRGRLKAEGNTGLILDALRSGAVDSVFADPADD